VFITTLMVQKHDASKQMFEIRQRKALKDLSNSCTPMKDSGYLFFCFFF